MYPLNTFWSVEPTALRNIQAMLANAIRNIGNGPTEDANRAGLPVSKSGSTAVVSIRGTMVKHAGWLVYYGFADTFTSRRAVEAAHTDEEIDTVVLRFDSPGGSVDGLAELGDAVANLAKDKRVIAQVDGMMASAAYYVASQAHEIYAGRMDLVGSIGTRMSLWDMSKMFEDAGVKVIPINTGEYKSAGEPGTEITENQVEYFQGITDGYFSDFMNMVMKGRNLTKEQLSRVADGRVFLASDALNHGLIDGIQALDETMAKLVAEQKKGRNTATSKARMQLVFEK